MTARVTLSEAYQAHRPSLVGYLTRLVVRHDVAEELVQQTALRALEQRALPEEPGELRAWLFRVATNLGLDHLRKHATWRETVLHETRDRARADAAFAAESKLLAGSPEMKAIAKEHLSVCFSCTSRNLAPESSAALLLKEVYGFTVDEVASLLGASFGQAKGWIQSARAQLEAKYAASCALVSRAGVCHQCVELDRFFRADEGDPLASTARDLDARLVLLRARRDEGLGPWHQRMMKLVDEVLDEGPEMAPSRPRGEA